MANRYRLKTLQGLSALLMLLFFGLFAVTNIAQGNQHSTTIDTHVDMLSVRDSNHLGKRNTAFKDLHAEFNDVLTCIILPIGVFGCFLRFVVFILILIALLELLREFEADDEKPSSLFDMVWFGMGILETAWSIYFLIAAFKTAKSCTGEKNYSVLRNSVNLDLATGFLSCIGAVCTLLCSIRGLKGFMSRLGIFAYFIALLTHGSQPPTLFVNVMRSVRMLKKITLMIGMWEHKKAFIATLIFEIIVSSVVIGVVYLAIKTIIGRITAGLIFAFVLIWAFLIIVVFGALGNGLLANIMDDPWGSHYAKTAFGKGLAVMTGLAPLLQVSIQALGIGLRSSLRGSDSMYM